MSSPKDIYLADDIDYIFPSLFPDVSKAYPTPETEGYVIDTSEDNAPPVVQGALAEPTDAASESWFISSAEATPVEDFVPESDEDPQHGSPVIKSDPASGSEIPVAEPDQASAPRTPVAEAPGAPGGEIPGESTLNRPKGPSSLSHAREKSNPTVMRRETRPRRVLPQRNAQRNEQRAHGRRDVKNLSTNSKPYRDQGRPRRRNQMIQPSGAQQGLPRREYEVERITDMCVEEGTMVQYYLVKWKGYGNESNTWEPKRNLAECRLAIEAFERKSGQKRGKKRVKFSSE